MRRLIPLVIVLLAAACGSGDRSPSMREDASSTAAADRDSGPPGISPTSAPGVAFNYRYAFSLPSLRIGPVQEEHAAACEKLGVTRCRITGMHYERSGDEEIEAQLAFKLDPDLARAFGKEGIEAVRRAGGDLERADITGTDVGTDIAAGARSEAELTAELQRLEQQLARPGLGAAERAQLQQQAQQLRDTLRGSHAQQTERREQLASTPVTFDYRADRSDGRLRRAVENSGASFVSGLTALIVVLLVLLPWAAAGLIGWLAFRALKRRFGRPAPSPDVSPPAA